MTKYWYCGKPVRRLDPNVAVKAAKAVVVASDKDDNNEPTSKSKPYAIDNGDGTGSFRGRLIGMGF